VLVDFVLLSMLSEVPFAGVFVVSLIDRVVVSVELLLALLLPASIAKMYYSILT